MTDIIKYAGLALIAAAAILIARRYDGYARRRLAETRGFINFLLHVRGRISAFLEPLPRAVRDFTDESLEALGFLGAMRNGETVNDAYLAVKGRSALGSSVCDSLAETFRCLGRGTREETLAFIDLRIDELTELHRCEEEELPKNVKLTRTLLYATALGVIILFI